MLDSLPQCGFSGLGEWAQQKLARKQSAQLLCNENIPL